MSAGGDNADPGGSGRQLYLPANPVILLAGNSRLARFPGRAEADQYRRLSGRRAAFAQIDQPPQIAQARARQRAGTRSTAARFRRRGPRFAFRQQAGLARLIQVGGRCAPARPLRC